MKKNIAISFFASLKFFFSDIKIAHSLFAMPFAVVGILLSESSHITWLSSLLILICMVSARSYAMGLNRFLDWKIDKANPRTKNRMIPSGKLSAGHGLAWSVISGAILIGSSFTLNNLAGYCSVGILLILGCYPLMKRLSLLTHWYLGFCLGLAPIAATVALDSLSLPIILIGLAVMFWTAGFDIIYALQDLKIDRCQNLYSIPARLGPRRAIYVSRFSFLMMIFLLSFAGIVGNFGTIYFVGLAGLIGLLTYEHWLVRDAIDDGQSLQIDAAFFKVNSWIGFVFLLFFQLDQMLG